MSTTKQASSSEVERAIRGSLCLEDDVEISRNYRLNNLCGGRLDSSDILDILSILKINIRDYFHDEAIDKGILRYALEQEQTALSAELRKKLYEQRAITPTDIFQYITAGHIERIVEYDSHRQERIHTKPQNL